MYQRKYQQVPSFTLSLDFFFCKVPRVNLDSNSYDMNKDELKCSCDMKRCLQQLIVQQINLKGNNFGKKS